MRKKPSAALISGPACRLIVLTTIALITGTLVSLLAILFVEIVQWLNDSLLISARSRIQISNPWLLTGATLMVPAAGGFLVAWLLQNFSTTRRPLGPPDVIAAVHTHGELPSFKAGLLSTGAAALSLGCGASVGQYGPMVYLGAMTGNLVKRLFQFRIQNLGAIAIACGVAAAISTAFNAPIAGLVFAHEVILRHYSIQAFAPTTVASAVGFVIANVVFERPPLFLVAYEGVQYSHEFLLFALIGLLAAGLAIAFMRLTLKSQQVAASLPLDPKWRTAIAGLGVGICALWLPDVLGVGTEALRFATIEGAFSSTELLMLVPVKILLTALCIGFGFAGGIFSPSLLIGILSGALFWNVTSQTLGIPDSGIAVYAICGMMALTSPIIGAPLSMIIIVFELTRSYDLTIAAMVSVVFANLIAYRYFGRSLFDVQLAGKGIDLSQGRDRVLLETVKAVTYQDQSYPACRGSTTRDELIKLLSDWGRAEALLYDEQNRYLGHVRLQDTMTCAPQALARDIGIREGLRFSQETTIWEAMEALDDFVGDIVPIVDQHSGELIGAISEASIINAYLELVHQLRREENESV